MLSIRAVVASTVGLMGFVSAPALALEVGETAPCVVLEQRLPNGSFADLCIRDHEQAQTHTIIEFFSITCSACAVNLPNVVQLGKELMPYATTRFVSIDRNREAILGYVASEASIQSFPVALDVERNARRAFDVVATPTLFVLDGENKVVFKHVGVLSETDKKNIANTIKTGN